MAIRSADPHPAVSNLMMKHLRVAVDLRIRIFVCVPHPSHCGLLVNAPSLHSLTLYSIHHVLSDCVDRSFASSY